MSNHLHSQQSLSELIQYLEKIRSEHGDLPIIYWDQSVSACFHSMSDFVSVQSEVGHVYIGGFHVNGSKFCASDPIVGNQNIEDCDH